MELGPITWSADVQDVAPSAVTPGSVVLYYMHHCGFCHQVAPFYNALGAVLRRAKINVPLYAVDAVKYNDELNGKVSGAPKIVAIDKNGVEHVFAGDRTLANIASFVVNSFSGKGLAGGKTKKVAKSKVKKARASPKPSPKRKVKKARASPSRKRLRGGDDAGSVNDAAVDVSDDVDSSSDSDDGLFGGAKVKQVVKKRKRSPSKSPSKSPRKAKAKAATKSKSKSKSKSLRGGDCYIEGGDAGDASDDSLASSSSSEGELAGGRAAPVVHKKAASPRRSPTKKVGHKKAASPARSPGRPARSKPLRTPTLWNIALHDAYSKLKKKPEYTAFVKSEKEEGRNGFVKLGVDSIGKMLKNLADARRTELMNLSAKEQERVLSKFASERDKAKRT